MREIKFRAWDRDGKFMVYPGNEREVMDFHTGIKQMTGYEKYEILKFFDVVMQYTGKADKNGVEVYEDDVVKYRAWGKDRVGVVRFGPYFHSCEAGHNGVDCLGFYVADKNGECIFVDDGWEDVPKGEVIGNVWESPDLLEVK